MYFLKLHQIKHKINKLKHTEYIWVIWYGMG